MSNPVTENPAANGLSANAQRELKLIAHSPLFYWWPVWVFGFIMAGWTYIENHRLAVVPSEAAVTKIVNDGTTRYELQFKSNVETKALEYAAKVKDLPSEPAFPARVSQHAWLGSVYVMILLLTIAITNIPLRGLWSFVVIILLVVIGLFITVFHGWDEVFDRVANLRVYINLAGYLTISIAVFIMWAA
ncbi:MAG: hypothetical protein ACRCZF_24140, partial [Gemmataceae bacterium]